MKSIKIKGSDTMLHIKVGRIELEKSDVIVNWISQSLRSGPKQFYDLHKRAGIQFFNACLSYEANVGNMNMCDCFTTIPGDLDCRIVLNSIMPDMNTMYGKSMFNIAETLKTYKAYNLCKSLSLYIPNSMFLCAEGIKEFIMKQGLSDVYIICGNGDEVKEVFDFFNEYKFKTSGINRINKFVDNLMMAFGQIKGVKKEKYGRENIGNQKENNSTDKNAV